MEVMGKTNAVYFGGHLVDKNMPLARTKLAHRYEMNQSTRPNERAQTLLRSSGTVLHFGSLSPYPKCHYSEMMATDRRGFHVLETLLP